MQSLHSASVPGILALDIHASDTSRILTGGADKNATVFNKDTEQIIAVLKGHTKKVSYFILFYFIEIFISLCMYNINVILTAILIEFMSGHKSCLSPRR